MRLLRNIPIRRKLTIITMLTSGVALLLACVAFVVYEQVTFRRTMKAELSVLTDLFDDNVAPGLTFNDAKSIETTLNSLNAHSHILAAAVYDKTGLLVALYQRADLRGPFPLPPARETDTRFEKDRLDSFRQIMLAGENIGTIYITSDLRELNARFWRYGVIVSLVLLLSSLVALALSAKLQHIISDPISHLSTVAHAVAIDKDYAVRAVKHGEDELGRLIDGFNEMLNQIQTRDSALQEAQGNLERRVTQRTEELQQKQSELRVLFDLMPAMILFKDTENRILRVNRRVAENAGKSIEEIEGKSALEVLPHDAARFYADDLEVIHSGAPKLGIIEKVRGRDGNDHWIQTDKVPVCDKDGKVVGIVVMAQDITERKEFDEKLEEANKQLLETSRRAGMAEVATGVLHNVGNVLNSVNVSTTLVADQLKRSKVSNLAKVVAMMEEHASDLGAFMTTDPKGKKLPGYLAQLATHLTAEQATLLCEMGELRKNIEHIKDIVAMQQSYAKVSGLTETLQVSDLIEDALRMNASALTRHEVRVVREFAAVPPVTIEKHKVLQILVNLIRNAKHACEDSGGTDKRLTVRVANDDGRLKIAISDNGVGIPAENLIRIFNHGFTTRKDGHGFGLHSGALAAKEMGGSLDVRSDGPGKGAVFTLELPVAPESNGKLNAA